MFEFLLVTNLFMVALLSLAVIIGAIACRFDCSKLFNRIFKICDGITTTICVLYLLEVFVLFSTLVFEIARRLISG